MSNDLEQQGDGGGESKPCPVCGVENPADAEVCIGCNFTFGEDMDTPGNEQTQEPQVSTEDIEENIVCNGCGAELPPGTTSCFICGEDVNAQIEDIPEETESVEPEADSEVPPSETEDWDLGVVGGDGVAEEPVKADDLDDELPPVDDEMEDSEIAEEDELEQVEEVPELGPNEFHCPSCGKPIPMGTAKCPNCWADLPEMTRCPQCDNVIPLASESCPECFAKLENGVLIEEPPEGQPVEAIAEIDEFDEPEEDLMPQEETDEFFEEVTEVYGVECPFCGAIANASDDICPECGMPLIEEDAVPQKTESQHLKYRQPERDWYRTIAFILVLVLLASAIIPFAIPLPHVDREQIRIDGAFGDWDPITTHNDTSTVSNQNIDIIDYKMISDAFNIYFYTQVAGTVFGDTDGDTSRIFIDLDQDSATGYSIMGIGADYQIRVFGHGGNVESSSCLQFDNTKAQNDFNGFESFCPSVPHTAETLEDNDKFEVRVALDDIGIEIAQPVTALYYMGDTLGNSDYSDTPLCNVGSILFVSQESTVSPSGIITGASADVLSLKLTAIGNPLDIAGVSIDNSTGTFPASMVDGEVQTVNLTTSATGRTSGSWVHEQAVPGDFDVPDAHVVVTGQGAYAYANAAPSTIHIDGAFADWAGKGMTLADMTDDQTMKNGIDANANPGLDMLSQTTAIESNNLNILVNSAGDMMAGMWVPVMEEAYVDTVPDTRAADADTAQPDYTYSQPQVDRTRAPDLQRPAAKPEKTGEGAVKIFIDTDNDPATGYIINDIGADYLMVAFGQNGQVTRTQFSSFTVGADRNMQDWTLIDSTVPDGASSGSNVEMSVPLSAFGSAMNNNATAVIQLVDWNLNGDISDLTAWDIFETGTRKGTRPSIPNVGVKGKLTLDGTEYADCATVIMKNSLNGRISTDISFVPLSAGANNYDIVQENAVGENVRMYAVNESHWGYREVTYPSGTDPTYCDFALDYELPDTSARAVSLRNLGTATKAIEVNWSHSGNPNEYWIYSTNKTDSYEGNTGVGRYYDQTAIIVPGNATSYLDYGAIENQTNYYIIESVDKSTSPWNFNYSMEFSIMADYWPSIISHNTFSDYHASMVPISANITDGAGVISATVHYRKGTAGSWAEMPMELNSGTPQNGTWEAWIPVDATDSGELYQYYITSSDGTYTSTFGAGGPGSPVPMEFNATSPGDDPYPIYGYVKWGDGSLVGAGVQVYVEWVNKSGPWPSSVLHDPNPGSFPAVTNAGSQYSIDMLSYDQNSIIWGNATIAGLWGYNVTMPDFPFEGGKMFNITLEASNLNITKTAPAQATPGDTITYTVTVTNTGNTTAYNVNITETYPPEVTFVSSAPMMPTYSDNVWLIGNLTPNSTYVLTIDVQIAPGTVLGTVVTNYVNASWTNYTGSVWGIVDAWANTTMGAAHLNMTKWASATANTGQQITYWLNYTNDGSDAASNVVITETYPAGVTFVSSIPPPDVGNNVWNIGIMNPGVSNSIQITVQVDANASGTLNNTALMTGFDFAGVLPLTNATAWAETQIIDPFMMISKEGPATANTGEIISYWLNYTNTGTDWAYDVVITETYDPGVTFVSSWPAPDIDSNTWNVGNLAPLAGGTILVNVSVDALSGTIYNTAILNYDDAQTELQAPVQAWLNTTILNSDMLLNKTAPATANTGEFITYTIDYFNIGTDTAVDVVITETYPAGVTFIGAIPPPSSGNNVWNIGNVAPGTGGTITITVQVDSTTTGTITNWVDLSFNNTAGITQPVVSASADTFIADPLMQITKEGPAAANPGQNITYWLNYTNLGTGNATNVVITETYPAGVTFVSSIPVPDVGNNVWNLGTLPPGASGSIQITVNINNGTSGTIMNTVMLQYWNDDVSQINPTEIYDWLNTTVSAPLMTIMKLAQPTASPGELIGYNIIYQNTGTDDAYNVVITETYPAGVTFVGAVPMPDVGNNVWNIGTVPAGSPPVIIAITVQADANVTGTLTNLANLTYEDAAGQPMPEISDTADTVITWPMMEIQKSGPATAVAGQTIMYTIDYQNTGTDTAHNVTITETYPADVTFVNATPMPTSGDNVWFIGDVANGTGGTIFINVTIDANATGLLANNATLDYETPGFVPQTPIHATWTTFLSGPYMTIGKTAPATANTGELITYTITYDNIGNESAENVVITETYPAGVTFINAVPAPDVGNNVWNIGTVAAGTGGVITITVQVDNTVPVGTVLTNLAEIDYENAGGVALPTESATADTTVVDPSMGITKTGPVTANTGEIITYTITYFNSGTEAAENVWINETYDAGVSFVSAWPMPDVGNYAWNIGTVAPGTGGTILVNVSVDAASGTIWNFADMNYTDDNGEYQPVIGDSWRTDIVNPLIVIDKTAPVTAAPGQTFTYTIQVDNLGNDWAYNVTVTETYPAGVTFVNAAPAPDFGNNVWIIPQMASGASTTITVTVTVNAGAIGILTNYVDATYNNFVDIPQTIADDWANTTVVDCLVIVEKSAPATANTGQQIIYWLNYTNTGTDWAYNIWINETYPADVTFMGAIPAPDAGNNAWNIAQLAPGATGSIQITVQVNAGVAIGTLLVNNVDMVYENAGGQQYTGTAQNTTLVIDPLMTVEKLAPAIAAPGEIIMYTIWYNNTGTDTAYNVVITETYPPEVTFLNANPAPTSGNNVWDMGNLPAGFIGVIFINVTVSPTASGTIFNSVMVESENNIGPVAIDTDVKPTLIQGPYIVIDKTAPATASDGETITYTITYQNTGPNTAYNVWINETYPALVSFVSAVPAPDVPNFAWDIGTLAPGAGGIITIQVLINLAGAPSAVLINNVTVEYSSDILGNNTLINWDEATTLVDGPLLDITKIAPATASTGEMITYVIQVTNNGNQQAINVNVTEFYPPGVTYIGGTAPTFGNNVWIFPVINPGDSEIITITVQVNLNATGTLMNAVSVDYQNLASVDWPTNWAWANTTIIDPDLSITKTGPATANTGEQITYLITVTNNGNDIAHDVVVMETYPGEVTFVSAVPAPDMGNNVWNLGNMTPGSTFNITITVLVTGTVSGQFTNTANVSYDSTVRTFPTLWANATTTLMNPALGIVKTAPATANTGQTITYTIWINNTGDDWAYNIVVTETYPAGATFVGSNPTPDSGNNVWDASISPLAPGGSTSIVITILVEDWASGWLNNSVVMDFENGAGVNQPDQNASASTQIIDPLMTVSKTAPAFATQGEFITYTITYQNIGTDTAYNVIITESYPAGVTFVGAVPAPDIGNNVWLIGNVAPGAPVSIVITVAVNPDATGTLVNDVSLDYEDAVGQAQVTETDQATTLIIIPTLTITKTAPMYANTGEIFTYGITVTNVGNDIATNVVVTELYPAGVAFIGAVPAPDIGNNIWTIGVMNPGAIVWINITVQVTAATGWLTNTAQADFENIAGQAYPAVQDIATTQVINPDVTIEKTAPATVNAGGQMTYNIWVNNTGDDIAYDVIVTETYPAGVTFVIAIPAPSSGNNVWNLGPLAAGASVQIQITVNVALGLAQGTVLINTATVDYNNSFGASFQVSDSADTIIIDPELTITKTGPAIAAPGEIIMYTITVMNTGTDWAYNVIITETYPNGTTFVNSTYPPDIGNNVWIIGAMAPGDGGLIFINVSVDAGTMGNITNDIVADYSSAASVDMQASANWTTLITGPFVTIQKTGPATATEGENITYSVVVENTGDNDAYNVVVTETYPADVTFVGAVPVPTTGNDTWDLGTMAPGDIVWINITVTVNTGATILINNVAVNYSSDAAGNVSAIRTDSVVTIVNNPWIEISKTAPASANHGETIMYTISFTNTGNANATNIWINETYPADVTFVNASIAPTSGNGTWYFATLAPNETVVIFINVTVTDSAPGIIYNYVELTFENLAGVTMPVQQAWANTSIINPLITITKTGPAEVNPGETFTYYIWYNNTGNDWAYNVTITEFYPAGVTLVSSIPLADIGNNVWIIPAMGPGATGMIQVTVTVTALPGAILFNSVEAEYNNSAGIAQEPIWTDLSTNVINPAMTISKIAPGQAVPGEFITYTIDYQNTGTDWAYNVVITENYPAGVTFVSAVPAPDIGDSIWQIGNVAPGGSGTITITVQVNNGTTGTLVNNVSLDYRNHIGDFLPTETASASTNIVFPALTVEKMAPATANTGETFTYRIWVNNTGSGIATNIVMTETYPAGITYQSAAPLPDAGDNVWFITWLLPGQTWFVDITVRVNDSAFGNLVNHVDVTYDDSIGQAYPPISDIAVTQIIDPLMDISKEGPAFANTGEMINYWLNYTNLGLDTAHNVVIIENYPAGVTFISAVPAPTFGNFRWDIGDIAAGATVSIQITVQIDIGTTGTLNNTVTLDYENNVRPMPQESAYLVTQIIDPLMTVGKTAPQSANPGEVINYVISYSNTGTDWAHDVVITETYPAGVIFVGAIPAPDIGNNVWLIGDVAPGASGSINITVQVNSGAVGFLDNSVTLDYNNSARALPTETAQASTEIIYPVITVDKTAPVTASPGETFTYSITVSNIGTDAAYNVEITEFYPAGINYVSASPLPDIGTNIWNLGTIPAVSSVVIDITVTVSAGALGLVTNHAVANFTDSVGTYHPEVHAWANTTIIGPIMQFTKDATPYANAGDTVTYWLNYSNVGTDTAFNVTITETYPPGMVFVSAVPMPDVGNNVWNIGTVAAGGSGSIVITMQATGLVLGQLENYAELEYENRVNMIYPVESDTAITAVGDSPLMTIDKTGPAQANAGETVTFVITYTNVGNVTAYYVNITDTYPFGLNFTDAFPAPTAGNNFWELGNISAGATATILVNMTVTGQQYGILSNVVQITYQNTTGTQFQDTAAWQINIVDAQVEITKEAPALVPNPSTVTYWLNYSNTGTDTAYDFVITESYPPGAAFVSAFPAPTSGDNIWQLGDLAPGASGTIMVNVTLTAPPYIQINNVTGTWNNTIAVTSWANATATTIIQASPTAIMVVEKWAQATVNPGGVIMYMINYSNLGAGAATGFTITETYPPGTAWLNSSIAPAGALFNIFNIGNVPGGASGTLFINVTVGGAVVPGTILMNQADYTYNDGASVQTGTVFANTTVVNPLVTITKTADAFAYAGQVIVYTITYQNTGNDTAYNLNITDTYPVDVTYTSAVPAPNFGDAIGAAASTWIIGAVPAGGSGTITVNAQVNAPLAPGTQLDNYAWLNYSNAAGQNQTDSDMATTTVVNDVVTLDKTGPATADPGDTITYLITYANEASSAGPVDITITEFYDGVTFVSAIPAPINPGTGDNIWVFTNVAKGSGGTISITVTVNNTAPDIITNQAMLNYTTGGIDVFINATATTVISGPLMQITKTGPVQSPPGQTIMYTIAYQNIGNGFANNVTITETYPAGVTFNSAWPVPDLGTNNVWTLGAIAPGGSGTITITVDISILAYGSITNWVQLTYQNMSGGNMPAEWASATTLITEPSITLEKIGPSIVNSGQQISYTLVYNNVGSGLATNVIIEDAFPAGLTYVSSTPPGINMGTFIRWFIGNVPGGTGGTITVTFDVTGYVEPNTFRNYAYLNYTDQSGTPYYRMDYVDSTVIDPHMTVTKWATPTANSGGYVTYYINYSNSAGPLAQPAYNVTITEIYDLANVAFVNAVPAPDMGNNVWNIGTVQPGGGGSIQITVQVLAGVANDTWIINNVNMSYENSAVPMLNETASAQTHILNPQLTINKIGPATANTGQQVIYTIWVNNTGGALAQNVIITETYPAELTFISAVPAPDIGNNVWQIGNLAAQGSVMITITLQVNDGTSGLITNTATANYTNENGNYLPEVTDTAPTTIIDPLLTVSKDVSTTLTNTGETIMYTVNVTNIGTDTAYNVNVTDIYSSWTSFVDASPAPTFGNDVWLLASILPGTTTTIFINVTVDSQSTVTNWIFVDYEDSVGEAQQQVSDYATTLVRDPSMEITKVANATAVIDGYILYTITYRNIGSGDAANVVITEIYSPDITFVGASIAPDNPGTGNDTWTIGNVPAGTGGSIDILVHINNNTAIGAIIANDVTLDYQDISGNAFTVSDSAVTTIIGPNMTVTKEGPASITFRPGITFDYYINYTNTGDWAYDVVIMDTLPVGLSVISTAPALSYVNGSSYYWNISSIAPGSSSSIRITVEVQAGTPTNITNNVSLSYSNMAGWQSPVLLAHANTSVIYLVTLPPAMEIIKTGPAQIYAGDMLNYSIEYWNNGTGVATNVIISENYPAGLTFWNSTVAPVNLGTGNDTWNLGIVPSGGHGWINITMFSNASMQGQIINNVSLDYTSINRTQMPTEYAEFTTTILVILAGGPPEVTTVPPEYVFAGQNFTLHATALDHETGIDTIILYWVDISGAQFSSQMVPLLTDTYGNGMYQLLIPPQPFKGIVSYFVWVNDTDGNANRTGIYDVPVRLPPYFVWGNIYSAEGTPVSNGIVQITDMETNETVMAMTDGTGHYIVDLATLYSGYLNGEDISVFATDGLYYGTNSSYIDLDAWDDGNPTGTGWPNRQVNVVLSEIPEFSMILTPIIGILILVVFLRRQRRREEDEFKY